MLYLAVFVFALVLRLAAFAAMAGGDPIPAASDMRTYYNQALGLSAGSWPLPKPYYHHPLMPYWVRLSFVLFGTATASPRLLNVLVSAGSCALAAALASELFDRRAGMWAGVLLALHQSSVFYASVILDVPITASALLALAWLALRPSLRAACVVGLLAGIATLGRGSLLLCIAALIAWLLARRRHAVAAAFAGAVLVAFAPVLIRNASHGCLCLSTNAAFNFWIGNHAGASGCYGYQALIPAAGEPPAASSAWFGRAFEFVFSQPLAWLALTCKKLALFAFSPDGDVPEQSNIRLYGLSYAPWLFFLPGTLALGAAALAGVVFLHRDKRSFAGGYVIALSYCAGVVLFFYEDRFRAPLAALYAVLAGYGIARAIQLVLSARRARSRAHA